MISIATTHTHPLRQALPHLSWIDDPAIRLAHARSLWLEPPEFLPLLVSLSVWSQLPPLLDAARQHHIPLYTQAGPPPPPSTSGVILSFPDPSPFTAFSQLVNLDQYTLLLHVDSRLPLFAIESLAQQYGLTTHLRPFAFTLAQWLACTNPFVPEVCAQPLKSRIYRIQAILPNSGDLLYGRAPRTAAGPDLSSLFWGTSETFGICTHATIRLSPLPSPPSFLQIHPLSISSAALLLRELLHHQIPPIDAYLPLHPAPSSQNLTLHLRVPQHPHPALKRTLDAYHPHPCDSSSTFPTESALHPASLACFIDWSELDAFLDEISSQTLLPISHISLAQAQHEGPTIFCAFSPNIPLDALADRLWQLHALISRPNRILWGDPRVLSPAQMDPLNAAILQRIKQDLDPAAILNPHFFHLPHPKGI